ncbi:hypothetical protein PSYMO_36967, partial [Pseudomonas amygdali pv. mori str. 301020]
KGSRGLRNGCKFGDATFAEVKETGENGVTRLEAGDGFAYR